MKLGKTSSFKTTLIGKKKPASKPSVDLDDDDDLDVGQPTKPKKKTAAEEVKQEKETSRSLTVALGGSLLASEIPEQYTVETLLDESEDNEERFKNRRKNTAVMVVPTPLTKQVSRKKVRELTTMFGQRADIILNLLEDDGQTDGALTLIQRTLLQTLVDVLPVVERAVRTSHGQRGVYQFNQCITQIRELTTDIQALRSRGQLGASVVERILRPSYLDLAVQLSLGFTEIDNALKRFLSPEDQDKFRTETLLVIKRNLATYVQQQYKDVQDGVISGLS